MKFRILASVAVCMCLTAHGQKPATNVEKLLDSANTYWRYTYDHTENILAAAEKLLGPAPTPDNAALFIRTNLIRIHAANWYSHYQESFEYISKNRELIRMFKKDLGPEYETFKIRNDQALGHLYSSIDDYPKALAVYSDLVAYLRQQPESANVCEILENITGYIADIHLQKGEYDASANLFLNSLRYYSCYMQYEKGPGSPFLTYRNIGQAYFRKKDYASARKYFRLAEDSLDVCRRKYPEMASGASFTVYESLAAYHRAMGNYDSSLLIFQKASHILGPDNPNIYRIYQGLGEAYAGVGNFSRAEEYYEKAERFLVKTEGTRSVPLGKLYLIMGSLHEKQRHLDAALRYYQKSMTYIVGDFEPKQPFDNPVLKNITSKKTLFSALQQKTEVLWKVHQQKKDTSLTRAWNTNQLALALLDSTTNEIGLNSDKVILAEQSFDVYEKGIQIAYELYHLTQEQHYADACFSLADRSKGLLLLENLRMVNRYAGVNQTLLDHEKIIRSELIETEQELYKLESRGEDSEELSAIRDRYAMVKHDYSQWMEKIKKEAPGYYKLRFDHGVISPRQVQQDLLKPGEALLEYFVGDSALVVFGYTQKNKYMVQHKLPAEFSDHVHQLREYLASGNDEKSDDSFRHSSSWLYDLLIRDCITQLDTGIASLTVIPDGLLGYVPFEILIDSESPPGHYLMKDYSIHYAYSATYLSEQFQKKSSGSKSFFAGFVSAGGEDSDSKEALGFLKGAQVEVASIVQMLGGGSSVFSPATKKDFLLHAGEYKVLHLAMHSLVNDQNPMLSELVFSDGPSDSVRDNRLTAIELYNMQLNADMAVLSACNTGTGTAHRGEGIMSMSRAFAFAGVPSAVISLWKVPDKATSRIMVNYYRFLKEGHTKDRALQLAKEAFIKDRPQMADPFYWSGFILTGNNDPLKFPVPVWWLWLAAVIVLASAFLVMARKGIHAKLLKRFSPVKVINSLPS